MKIILSDVIKTIATLYNISCIHRNVQPVNYGTLALDIFLYLLEDFLPTQKGLQ